MPAWFDQDDAERSQGFKPSCCEGGQGACADSAQPCGCDPGCKPRPHYCEQHLAEKLQQESVGESNDQA